MGGKSSQSTQTVSIPPEILARYNAVNARAETTAQTPFQQYSTNPADFVAPLTSTQQAGIANTNYYAGAAQPYYAAATEQLAGAQRAATPYYGQATNAVSQGQGVGSQYANTATRALAGAQDLGLGLANQAYGGMNAAYQGAQPFNQAASAYMLAGSQAVNPEALGGEQIGRYMSPYLGTVLQGTAGLQNQMNQQAMAGQLGNAIRSGAFGGDRAGIAAANLAQQQQLANSKIFSDILNQGYGQALGTAQQQQQLGLSAEQANRAALQQASQQALGIGQQGFGQGMTTAQQQAALGQQLYGQGANTAQQLAALGQQQFGQNLASSQQMQALGQGLYGMGANTSQQLAALGQGAQGAGLQGAQAQLAAGLGQQQTEQAGLQALYNQFLQQQSYPFQTAQFLANIAMGTGALSGSTTQTNQMGGGFSDRRLKENIREVGKTFDGQTIYSYNFKGSPKTEIGLMAQEVEKKHPEAVGLAGGYKTVRYDKATDDAADRGHFAYGGSAMGGGVMPQHAGEGFYDGGYVGGFDPALMQQILSSYQQMYAPMGVGQNAGGLGAASIVPQGNLPVGSLMTAGELPAMPSATENASNMVSLGKNIGEIGGKVGAWNWDDEEEKNPDRKDLPKEFSDGEWRRGGRAGLAAGGVPTELSIPNEREKIEPLKPAEAPERPKDNTMSTIMDAAKIAMMFAKNGGRIGYADGGMPYGQSGGYLSGVLDEQAKAKNPTLNTPTGAAPQISGILDKAQKGLKIVNGVMSIANKFGFADGGLAGGNNQEDQGPDFNLDPEDLIAGEDQTLESLLRSSAPAMPAEQKGLAPLTFGDEAMRDWSNEKAQRAERLKMFGGLGAAARPEAPKPTGNVVARGAGVRSVRNNNPGNIEDGSFAKGLPGYAGSDGRFAIFENPNAGRSAQLKLISSYINRGFDTPWKIASRWAPPTEKGNDVPKYAKKIAQMAGVGIHDRVSHAVIPQIANAQTIVEGGQKALQYFLPGKSEGGLIGRHGYKTDGLVVPNPEEEKKNTGLAAAAPTPEQAPEQEILVNAKREKPKALLPELPQRGITYGRGTAQKPAYFGGSNIPGYSYDYMTEPFFKGLAKGSASSWIPLITGLGTYATTPTRSPISGLLAGASAGAQTYAALANERNKQIPARQAASARQAEVARILSNSLLRQDPNDPSRFIYMYPGARMGISIDAGQRQQILQQMLTGNMNYMPPPPEGAREWSPTATVAPKYTPSRTPPNNNTVEGIVEGAMQIPEVRSSYEAYLQAKKDLDRAQSLVDSPFGSDEDRARAREQLAAAGQVASTNKAAFESFLGRFADPKLAVLGTSASQIGASNIATYERRVATADAYQDLKPVLSAIKENGYGAGALSGILNWAASAADTIGLPKELFGDIRTASQRQEALAALLADTGIAADVATIERDPEALKAVVNALEAKIARSETAAQAARRQISPTATPTLLNPTVPSAAPGQPGTPAPTGGPSEPRRMPVGNDRFGYSSDKDALSDPRLPRGSRYYVWDGKTFGEERIKP